MRRNRWFPMVRTLGTATLLLTACSGHPSDGGSSSGSAASQGHEAPAVDVLPSDRIAARTIFEQRCTPCHGAEGKGDGPAAAALTPKPRNFTDAAWQKSVTDEQIVKAVTFGGAAVGKSPTMPPNPDLADKPGQLAALAQRIRKLGTP